MNPFSHLIGTSPEFQALLRSAQIVAHTDVTLLLLGESGTGKEMLAQALHQASQRARGPLRTINCAALPEGLAESELFGHVKGAFTGAVSHHSGRIRAADGGTLFLDEVGELSPSLQAKLLRFLESGEVQPVGSTQVEKVDVRLITATHRDLFTLVQQGRFRADLYYRLNVVPLELPPLRQRMGDTLALLDHFTSQLAEHHGVMAPTFTKAARKALQTYAWPGNLRELRNLCERMVVLHAGQTLDVAQLPQEVRAGEVRQEAKPFQLPDEGIVLEELEQQIIHQALHKSRGNRSKAARLLGLTRDTLLYRIKKYAIG